MVCGCGCGRGCDRLLDRAVSRRSVSAAGGFPSPSDDERESKPAEQVDDGDI